jgi:hypothetical protein
MPSTMTSSDPSTRRRRSPGSPSASASAPVRAWWTWRRGRAASRVGSCSSASTWSPWSQRRTCARSWRSGSRRSERSWRGRSRRRSITRRSMPSSWATRSTTSTATPRWRRSAVSCGPEGLLPCSGQFQIPGMRAIYEAIDGTHAQAAIMAAHRSWAEPPATVEGFDPFERREFSATHVLPAARLADLYATFSDVVSLPGPTRARLLDRIKQLSRGLPETLHLPGRTVVDLCMRDDEPIAFHRLGTGESG